MLEVIPHAFRHDIAGDSFAPRQNLFFGWVSLSEQK